MKNMLYYVYVEMANILNNNTNNENFIDKFLAYFVEQSYYKVIYNRLLELIKLAHIRLEFMV